MNLAFDKAGGLLFGTVLDEETATNKYESIIDNKVDFYFEYEVKGAEEGPIWVIYDREFSIRFLFRGTLEDCLVAVTNYSNLFGTSYGSLSTGFAAVKYYKLNSFTKRYHFNILPLTIVK